MVRPIALCPVCGCSKTLVVDAPLYRLILTPAFPQIGGGDTPTRRPYPTTSTRKPTSRDGSRQPTPTRTSSRFTWRNITVHLPTAALMELRPKGKSVQLTYS